MLHERGPGMALYPLFAELDGAPLTLDTRSVLAGTPAIHAQALQRLRL